jgi:hypothetical protein
MLKIYGSVVQEVKDEMKRQGREDEFIGSRVLLYALGFRTRCLLTVLVFLKDHLLHHQGCHTGGTGMVHRGLSSSQAAVP